MSSQLETCTIVYLLRKQLAHRHPTASILSGDYLLRKAIKAELFENGMQQD